MPSTTTNIQPETHKIGVVGLGYVGLPLLLAYINKGFHAIGFDIDNTKTEKILAGKSYIKHISGENIAKAAKTGRLHATTDFARVSEVDAIILCVPTPLDHHLEPDLSYVRSTLDSVIPHLKSGSIISLESTTYPGTTEEEILPRLQQRGLIPGETIYVVYSPEREDPGNPKYQATNIPKVVGGHTAHCLEQGVALYRAAFDQIVPVSSTKVAELTKLLENIYRAVNIGLANEMKIVADAMGIDIWEVIDAAATKPFGFTPFYPGPGLGGHCIPIDPFYLTWKAREFGLHTKFIELAGQINRSMPDYVIGKVVEALNNEKKSVNGSRILLLGLAYKPNVDDDRESPSYVLMEKLEAMGAIVDYNDPYVPVIRPTREHPQFEGRKSVEISHEYDCLLLATHHDQYKQTDFTSCQAPIVDTRNCIKNPSSKLYLA